MYICSNCWKEHVKWSGQCSFCKEWNTLQEVENISKKKGTVKVQKKELIAFWTQNIHQIQKFSTSSQELNTLLDGWFTPGSAILLSGEPGIGKSTLALQLTNMVQKDIVYISGEENASQILARAHRLGIQNEYVSLLCDGNIETILATLTGTKAEIVILDSISVMESENITGQPGSISQVREIASKMVEFCKSNNIVLIMIGHVNKDGNLAGPKTLEHLVDTVLYFEWDRYEDIRILRSLKNRFGPSGEMALFQMTPQWLIDMPTPEMELTASHNSNAIGASLSITLEGSRAFLVEVEALTNKTESPHPIRSSRGMPTQKLDIILAVLGKYTSIKMWKQHVYTNLVRGMNISEPGIDLSIAAAIISSKLEIALPRDTVFIGEISLTGRIKNCFWIEKRIKQAVKLNFSHIVLPEQKTKESSYCEVSTIRELVKLIEKYQ